MGHRGKWVIAGGFLLALAASLFALWYLNWQSQRSVAFWGRDVAGLIVHAPRVELLRLSPAAAAAAEQGSADQPAEHLTIAGQELAVVERRDAANARGLINVRRGLLADATYDWQDDANERMVDWQYALRFTDGSQQATVAFGFDPPRIVRVGEGRMVSIEPVGEGLEAFFVDSFR